MKKDESPVGKKFKCIVPFFAGSKLGIGECVGMYNEFLRVQFGEDVFMYLPEELKEIE